MTTAAMAPSVGMISDRTADTFKKRWDNLRGREHDLSRERAALLHEVWSRLQFSDSVLETFLVSMLGEYPGKRCRSFVRLTHAYNVIQSEEIWTMIGGQGVVLLSRMDGRSRRVVLRRVRETLKRTGRETVHIGTVRSVVISAIGQKAYQALLIEHGVRRSLRAELLALKGYILPILRDYPEIYKKTPSNVRKLLGVDILERV